MDLPFGGGSIWAIRGPRNGRRKHRVSRGLGRQGHHAPLGNSHVGLRSPTRRTVGGILDPLMAKAIVFAAGDDKVALVELGGPERMMDQALVNIYRMQGKFAGEQR
jgi:hypothetical protein